MSILLIDSYDSFTYNLKNLLQTAIPTAQIHTIHNDSYKFPKDEQLLKDLINSIDAIVIGPGPGNPTKHSDIGIISFIYQKFPNVPILGICLGFQTLCLNYGLKVDYLNEPIHGQIHTIDITDAGRYCLYSGFPSKFDSVRYHSIYVVTDDTLDMAVSEVEPLAYYSGDDGEKVLMAGKHKINPHYGVQYHPESICSSFGQLLVSNFWQLALEANIANGREVVTVNHCTDSHLVHLKPLIDEFVSDTKFEYQFEPISLENLNNDVLCLCESIKQDAEGRDDFVVLNSAMAPGEWTIVGLPIVGESDVISHSTEVPSEVHLSKWGTNSTSDQTTHLSPTESIWTYIANYMKSKYYNPKINDTLFSQCPFIGGLVGFFSYEEGQHIQHSKLEKITKTTPVPDTKLCFIDRFIAIHNNNSAFVVSVRPNDSEWLEAMVSKLSMTKLKSVNKSIHELISKNQVEVVLPNKEQYFESFHNCQKFLRSGDSYELCLTCPTLIKLHSTSSTSSPAQQLSPWELYKNLVTKNPSPYSMYLNFPDVKLLSTSPERFISWEHNKFAEMRPIKGTVKKSPEITLQKAIELLKVPKEIGENLMIVDLIRHDLFQFLNNVKVEKLMSVEEYHTVYQLVSVIRAYFDQPETSSQNLTQIQTASPTDSSPKLNFKGLDLLHSTLPPGSMTGAPKKRSIELLHALEQNKRRGIYSGCCGYLGLNDFGDFSVIIRSLFSYSDDVESSAEGEKGKVDCWRCGAGGAITVLSTDVGEWEEMLIKLDSVLQIFEDVSSN
ncbi:unnamed protein product [Ambrosiozyma monospora]|uniref:aminodeoxychorismate synthase n=1 Tax=Ambrosiozyma monospora TaxID=43982 RepID=A0A9W6YTX7_AMBMO|nr:unnamed protein product [Ambrosiozyma monospora]